MNENKQLDITLPAVPATLDGLHIALFDEINLFRASKVSASHARALSTLAKQVINAYTLQMVASGHFQEPRQIKALNDVT